VKNSCKNAFVRLQVAMNPNNTVFDAKRLIGRKHGDASVQSDIKHWPFTVKSGPAEKPIIEGKSCHHKLTRRLGSYWHAVRSATHLACVFGPRNAPLHLQGHCHTTQLN